MAYPNGTEVYSGYVSSAYVNIIQFSKSVERGIIATDILNVRSGAGTGYTALSIVTRNTEVDLLQNITSSAGQVWHFISYLSGGTRYCRCVLSDYVTTLAKLPAPSVPKAHVPTDAHVLRLTGSGSAIKKLTQTITLSGNAGDVFVANTWGASDTVPLKDSRTFGVEMEFVNTDGTKDAFTSNFGADTADWQYLSDVFVSKKAYTSFNISYIYGYNENMAYFDGLSVYKEEFGQSFTYDANGNVVRSADAARQSGSFEYDSNNNMNKLVARGNSFTYAYDTRHNVTSAVSAANMKYMFGYDTYGNAMQADIVNPANTSEFIRTKSTYTADGNYLQSIVDALGNTVTYSYNTAKGTLTSMTDARSKTTSYDYNAVNQLSSVMKDVTVSGQVRTAHTGYGYENDRLNVIAHNGFTYQMGYDGFGNRTSYSVAGQALATYVYAANNGNLINLNYGNGTTLVYNYDQLDRVTGMSMTQGSEVGTELYTYTYNNQGNLALINDKVNNVTYRYFYDMTDRPVMTTDSLGNSFVYAYDANNNLTKMSVKSNSGTVDTTYVYDADNRETQTKAPSKTLTTAYDALGRVASRTWNTTTAFATTYGYKAGANGSQSAQLASITNKGQTISYNYDANGNITNIIDGNGTSNYYYDELNQLLHEDNRALNRTIVYFYDAAGNIQSKNTYAFTTSGTITANPLESISYTYDAVWRDKLTSYGNNIILYDNIGNPIRYCGWSMGWTQGRRLAYMDKGAGVSLGFAYNPDGIRTRKTDLLEGLEYHYQLAGDKIVGICCQEISNGSLVYENKFVYNSAGDVVAMRYNGTEYYYMKNGQGDIIGIVDAAGNVIVNYSYDSWGKLLSVTGNMTLGYRNPFRYRGYCVDDETGLYLAGTRYYNPIVGRFINADVEDILNVSHENLLQDNLFTYCFNNPINMIDVHGMWPEWIKKAVAVVAVAAAVVTASIITVSTFGLGSVAGITAISTTLTLALRTFEVVSLQSSKCRIDGKNMGQTAVDCVESIYNNGSRIIGALPLTKPLGFISMYSLTNKVEKIFNSAIKVGAYAASRGDAKFSFAMVSSSLANTMVSVFFSADPVKRANERKYILK